MYSVAQIAFLLATTVSFPSVSAQKQLPPPGQVAVQPAQVDTPPSNPNFRSGDPWWDTSDSLVREGGTGCRPGTVGTVLAADNSFMTLIFDQFKAEVGPDITAQKRRAFCRVNVKLAAPSGWSYDIDSTDYRAYCKLDKGVSGTVKATYEYVGEKGRGDISKSVEGPLFTDFLLHQTGEVANRTERPCTTSANSTTTFKISVAVALRTDNRTAVGLIQADSGDASFRQVVNLNWKKC